MNSLEHWSTRSMSSKAGFTDVRVDGSGATRHTEALWPGPDTTAEMPAQIATIAELPNDPVTHV
jgi:hypothetical protein